MCMTKLIFLSIKLPMTLLKLCNAVQYVWKYPDFLLQMYTAVERTSWCIALDLIIISIFNSLLITFTLI